MCWFDAKDRQNVSGDRLPSEAPGPNSPKVNYPWLDTQRGCYPVHSIAATLLR